MTKEGLDCILDYETMKVMSATSVDNVDVNDFDHPHFYLEKLPRESDDVIRRLVRICNNVKMFRAHTRKGFKYTGMNDEEVTDKLNLKVYE